MLFSLEIERLWSSFGMSGLSFCFPTPPGAVGQLEGHLRVRKHKQNGNAVDDIEEDDLGKEELRAVALKFLACLSIFVEERPMGKNVGHEAENGVHCGELVDYEQEHAAHNG